ncbi:MAG: hypothetical protein UU32_C0028G0005 [Candidatus Woesebacteria bacterium GW2011_GWB1_41_10]|uniref:PIN domain-containing protein n=1 Tax=Candidatus Woesebacteria bacterium GW2011_GWB1_41_10 TaxID=1618577 RepID=A0A0G0UER8_9BACT|nr:MAG: hypothetical protein UU32_C0028G0005 [Candidatus Woesebacteria bacterium GW2011_GWB1_41_10]
MAKLRVFIDTNVWFSTIYGSRNSEAVVQKHISGEINAVVSKDVLEELIRNTLAKIPQSQHKLKKLLETRPPKIVKVPQKTDLLTEKFVHFKDQWIFQAAVDSKSDYFVTGNIKDFDRDKLEKEFKIKIVSPKEFLEI